MMCYCGVWCVSSTFRVCVVGRNTARRYGRPCYLPGYSTVQQQPSAVLFAILKEVPPMYGALCETVRRASARVNFLSQQPAQPQF